MVDAADTGKIQKVGDKNNDEIVPLEKQKKRRELNSRQEPALWPGRYGSR